MVKIYTKGGDKGQTSLLGGQRVSKNDHRIEAYGTIDELNSCLGVARSSRVESASPDDIDQWLELVQHWLFDLGSLLAAEPQDRIRYKLPTLTAKHIQWLELRIDEATAKLPALKQFILPGGSSRASSLHLSRTIARRAERIFMDSAVVGDLPEFALEFINRLSDFLFVMARYANHVEGINDVCWKHNEPPVS